MTKGKLIAIINSMAQIDMPYTALSLCFSKAQEKNKGQVLTGCCPNAVYTMGLFKIGNLIKAKDDAAFSLVPRLPA